MDYSRQSFARPQQLMNAGDMPRGLMSQQQMPQPQMQQPMPQQQGGSKGMFDAYMSQIFNQKYTPPAIEGVYGKYPGGYSGFFAPKMPAPQQQQQQNPNSLYAQAMYNNNPPLANAAKAFTGGTSVPDFFHPSFLEPGGGGAGSGGGW